MSIEAMEVSEAKPQVGANVMKLVMGGPTKPNRNIDLDLARIKKLPYPQSSIFEHLLRVYGMDFSADADFRSVLFVRPSVGPTEIRFSNNGKLYDHGDRIVMERNPPLKEAVAVMVKLAKAKGWQRVEFSGSEEFLLAAWEEAMAHGLEICVKPEQKPLWAKFQTLCMDKKAQAKDQVSTEQAIAPPANDPVPSPRRLRV